MKQGAVGRRLRDDTGGAIDAVALIELQAVGNVCRIASARVSTAPSSIAIAAPCARYGSVGWAESPSSVTRLVVQFMVGSR